MDAIITIKASPAEFDLIRRALATHRQEQTSILRAGEASPALRREARAEHIKTSDLLGRLAG